MVRQRGVGPDGLKRRSGGRLAGDSRPWSLTVASAPDSAFRAPSVGLEVGHAGETTLSLETSVVLQNSATEHRDRITGGGVLERAQIGISGADDEPARTTPCKWNRRGWCLRILDYGDGRVAAHAVLRRHSLQPAWGSAAASTSGEIGPCGQSDSPLTTSVISGVRDPDHRPRVGPGIRRRAITDALSVRDGTPMSSYFSALGEQASTRSRTGIVRTAHRPMTRAPRTHGSSTPSATSKRALSWGAA